MEADLSAYILGRSIAKQMTDAGNTYVPFCPFLQDGEMASCAAETASFGPQGREHILRLAIIRILNVVGAQEAKLLLGGVTTTIRISGAMTRKRIARAPSSRMSVFQWLVSISHEGLAEQRCELQLQGVRWLELRVFSGAGGCAYSIGWLPSVTGVSSNTSAGCCSCEISSGGWKDVSWKDAHEEQPLERELRVWRALLSSHRGHVGDRWCWRCRRDRWHRHKVLTSTSTACDGE